MTAPWCAAGAALCGLAAVAFTIAGWVRGGISA